MLDIVDYLQSDLDALREMIIELRVAEENSPQEAKAFTALVSLVQVQNDAQNSVLRYQPNLSVHLQRLIASHSERMDSAREVENIIECCTNRSTWRASVNVYCELLENEIGEMQLELLSSLHDELDSSVRREMALSYRKLRGFGRAPTNSPKRTSKNWQKIWENVINQAG